MHFSKIIHVQLHQLINLVLLLLVGNYVGHIYQSWVAILAVILITIAIEHLFIFVKYRAIKYFSYSSATTAIGVLLMMLSPHLWVLMIVITLGLFQKHFVQFEGKHFFNPSNFALIMGLLLFYNDAHMVLGQLGNELWLQVSIALTAIAILYRANRWIIPLVFISSYLILQYYLVVINDPLLIQESINERFYSVSFLVFIVFMLTDPKTTPDGALQQALFALILTLVATLLDRVNGFRVQHLFMALFLLSLFVPIITQWNKTKRLKILLILTAVFFVLALGVIISIEGKVPYYFEMNS